MVNDIAVQEFVNAIKEEPTDTNTTYSATVSRIDNEGVVWVNIHGSEKETPTASTSTEVKRGDAVTVNWRNNRLYIAGNYSNPSAGITTVQPSVNYVNQLVSKNVSAESITASTGYIGELTANNITAESISADHAMIQELDVGSMSAAVAYIGDLTAENITAEDIAADHATVNSLDTNYAHISNGVIDNASIGYADVNGLSANYAHITSGVIDNATIGYADVNGLSANYASISDLSAATGRIDSLEANEAVINDTLTATNAHVEYLESDWISTDRLVLTGNNKNNYPPVEITEAEFNVNKTAYYTKNGTTYTQCTSSSVYDLDTQYYVKQTVKSIIEAINTANNTDPQIVVSNDKLIAASMDVAELSAITADMGTLTAGKIEKGNNYINLDTSPASMEFKNASTWSGATQGIKFDTQGNLAIKGTVDITSSNTIYNKSQIDEALADKADADDVYSKSDFSITPSEIVSKVTATEVKLAGMYATCSTNAGTTNKIAIISPNVDGWSLYTGATVTVKFSTANTVASPNLCVKGKSTDTGSNIAIKTLNGGTLEETDYKWSAGDTLTFIYNGTNWLMQEASARMKTAEASITTNAGNILLKANAEDVYTKQATNALLEVKANKDTLTSEINASADTVKINANRVNITGTAVFDAVNNDASASAAMLNSNIEIGGRNLLSKTKEFTTDNTTGFYMTGHNAPFSSTTYNGLAVRSYPSTTLSSGSKVVVQYDVESIAKTQELIKLGETYVCSFWAKGSGKMNLYFYRDPAIASWVASDGTTGTNNDGAKVWTLSSSWERYWIAWTTNASATYTNPKRLLFRHDYSSSTATLQVDLCGIKLEKGNKATDWSPAPEDVQAEIDTKKNVHTLLSGNSSGTDYSTILGYAKEGATGTFSVNTTSTPITNVKVDDSVRLGYYVSDMGTAGNRPLVYINATVTAIPSATQITIKAHGLDTTIIDGGNIITNSIGANQLNTNNINNSELLTTGALTVGARSDVLNSNVQVGGRNLFGYGSQCKALDGFWTVGAWNIATEDGYQCAHTSGAKSETRYLQSKLPFYPRPNETVAISAFVKIKNISYGTTNPMCEFYLSGQTIDGTWRSQSIDAIYVDGVKVAVASTNPVRFTNYISDTNWHHIAFVRTWQNYAFTNNMLPSVYLRDATGDLYIRNIKYERGNKATDWTPAQEDIDAGISNAAQTATSYLTVINGTTGISVHNATDENNFVNVNSSGIKVYKGGNSDNNVVASFGDTVRLGNKSATHAEISSQSLDLMVNDAVGIRIITDNSNNEIIEGTGTGDGTTQVFYFNSDHTPYVSPTLYSEISAYSATINGELATAYNPSVNWQRASGQLKITSMYFGIAPPTNSIVKFSVCINGKNHIDVGTNNIFDSSTYGVNSVAIGKSAESSGNNSLAAGSNCTASGSGSVAFNSAVASAQDSFAANMGVASESYSAAFGDSNAYGMYSFSTGKGTIARTNSQAVVGKYNKDDTNGDYAFIIGNGEYSTANQRSNALTVDWNGNVTVNNHSSPIGTIKRGEPPAAVSVPDKTFTALCSVSLEPGTWIVICTVRAPSNATGFRMANLATTAAVNACNACIPAVSANVTQFDFTKIVEPTEPTPYYLNVYHNAGTSLIYPTGSTNYITAIRIL